MYSYKFAGGTKPVESACGPNVPKGFLIFDGGAEVDWSKKDYIDGKPVDVVVEEPPAPYVPTPEELKQQHNAPILSEISQLEAKQHRAVREHILGDATATQLIANINTQITLLRSQLQ